MNSLPFHEERKQCRRCRNCDAMTPASHLVFTLSPGFTFVCTEPFLGAIAQLLLLVGNLWFLSNSFKILMQLLSSIHFTIEWQFWQFYCRCYLCDSQFASITCFAFEQRFAALSTMNYFQLNLFGILLMRVIIVFWILSEMRFRSENSLMSH